MKNRLHRLRKKLREGLNDFRALISENPLLILLFGLVQLGCYSWWPSENWKPFPLYGIPITGSNPLGVIHSHSYAWFIHNYLMFIFVWLFIFVATKYKWQMKLFLVYELLDVLDFVIRYNQKMFDIIAFERIAWELTYTDIKKIIYAIIIYKTWKHNRSSSAQL